MWLINCRTHKLKCFIGSNIPKYAILSHTWEDEEVTFQELALPFAVSKKGYSKIKETCARVRRHGLKYAWIDTCCIDKSSSAELTECINSMFQSYKNAELCYVFLSDMRPGTTAEDGLAACKWFTRGWTLQELIAPRDVRFYDKTWNFIGTKADFSDKISLITGIDEGALLGHYALNTYSIATRMSWASHRKTTRIEDLAYCLLGIFDVSMPMIYGEGPKAFRRLQEEIVRGSNDLTVFAWDKEQEGAPFGLFAPSPAAFAKSNDIQRFGRAYINSVFAMTNKGLKFDNFKFFWKKVVSDDYSGSGSPSFRIPLGICMAGKVSDHIYMQLRKIGPNIFIRDGGLLRLQMQSADYTLVKVLEFYLHGDTSDSHDLESFKLSAVHFPRDGNFEIQETIPESHYTDRLFFAPLDDTRLVLAASCVVTLGGSVFKVVVCIHFTTYDILACRIFDAKQHNQLSSWLFRHKRLGHDVSWDDVEAEVPEILDFTHVVEVSTEVAVFRISASINKGIVPSISEEQIYSVNFDIEANSQPISWPSLGGAEKYSFDSEDIGSPWSPNTLTSGSSPGLHQGDQWIDSGEWKSNDRWSGSRERVHGGGEVDNMHMQMGGLSIFDSDFRESGQSGRRGKGADQRYTELGGSNSRADGRRRNTTEVRNYLM
jgi:hypothetical protein